MKILTKDELDVALNEILCSMARSENEDEVEKVRDSHAALRGLLRRLWEYLPWHMQDAIELDNPELYDAVVEAIGDG